MPNYSKPVWQMIRELAENKEIFTTSDVKKYISEKYADDGVKENTISAQTIAHAINHPSAHYYGASNKFLFYLGNSRYRLYNPEKDGNWNLTREGPQQMEEIKTNDIIFTQVNDSGQVVLPKSIRERLAIGNGDFVAFQDKDGVVILKKAGLRVID